MTVKAIITFPIDREIPDEYVTKDKKTGKLIIDFPNLRKLLKQEGPKLLTPLYETEFTDIIRTEGIVEAIEDEGRNVIAEV